jgi:hypothetical protein
MTGQLEEEKMQVYVRLGIRLLYKVSNRNAAVDGLTGLHLGCQKSHGGCERYLHILVIARFDKLKKP